VVYVSNLKQAVDLDNYLTAKVANIFNAIATIICVVVNEVASEPFLMGFVFA
jgi:hypothetical protein